MSECKDFRMDIGKQVLQMMEKNDDLPMPNCHRLSKTMQEYFRQEGLVDLLKEQGYKWVPTIDYWMRHIPDVAEYMRREYKLYFGYLRDMGKLVGQWRFMKPDEWEESLRWDHSSISTRVDNYNQKIGDSEKEYAVSLPFIDEVPRLT